MPVLTVLGPARTTAAVSSSAKPSVIVVGAGLVGCAIAHELAPHAALLVLERSVPGAEASSVAAGILAPRIEHDEGPLLGLGLRSLEVHARWSATLRAHGLETGHRVSGAISLAFDEAERATLLATAARLSGAQLLEGAALFGLEPALSRDALAGLHLPHEAQVEPPRLLRALALSAEANGAVFRTGVEVRDLRRVGDRVTGIALADGTFLAADAVVVAAGSWTGVLPGLPEALRASLRPVRGQLLHLDARRPLVSRILFGGGGYVVPRADGRVVIGATMEEAGFDKTITLGGAHAVMSRALRVVPALGGAELVSHAVNFRPASSDALPVIGEVAPGLLLASGHFRNGILLAPATAEMIADRLLGRAERHPSSAFSPSRFAARPSA